MKQNNPKIIGITGGIATGKSTVTDILIKKGYIVIDADKIARQVVDIGLPAYEEVVSYFGESILKEDGTIDRQKLGNQIFCDESSRKKLNDIVHPYVLSAIKKNIDKYIGEEKILFLDIPLLIEEIDKFQEHKIYFDEIWLIYVDEKTQLNRLLKRDGINEKEGIYKIKAQMPIDMKKDYATRIIDNRGDKKALEKQIDDILFKII